MLFYDPILVSYTVTSLGTMVNSVRVGIVEYRQVTKRTFVCSIVAL